MHYVQILMAKYAYYTHINISISLMFVLHKLCGNLLHITKITFLFPYIPNVVVIEDVKILIYSE